MLTEEEKGFLNAPDINQVKDFLSNAFKNKNNGNPYLYSHLVQQLRIRDDPETLWRLYISLSSRINQITSRPEMYRELIQSLYTFNWTGDKKIIISFINLVSLLVSSNPIFLIPSLQMLVKTLIPQLPSSSSEELVLTPTYYQELKERQVYIHRTIYIIFHLAPAAILEIYPILVENFPHKRLHTHIQQEYVTQLLLLCESYPQLQGRIIELIFIKCLELDVDIVIEDSGDTHIAPDEETDENNDLFQLDDNPYQDTTFKSSRRKGGIGDEGSKKIRDDVAETAQKLDSILVILLSFIQGTLSRDNNSIQNNNNNNNNNSSNSNDNMNNNSLSEKLFRQMFEAFESRVMTTYKAKYVQFTLFYSCQLNPYLGNLFLHRLISLFLDSSNHPLSRQSAVVYLASLIARGNFISFQTSKEFLSLLLQWACRYIQQRGQESIPKGVSLQRVNSGVLDDYKSYLESATLGAYGKQGQLLDEYGRKIVSENELSKHETFFCCVQAMCYAICFLGIPMAQTMSKDPTEKRNWEIVLNSEFHPLRFCIQSVRTEFLRISIAGGLISPTDSLSNTDSLSSNLSIRTNGNGILSRKDSHHNYNYSNHSHNPLDTFFPFDPCLLCQVHEYIKDGYRIWESENNFDNNSDNEKENNSDNENDDDDDNDNDNDDDYEESQENSDMISSVASSIASIAFSYGNDGMNISLSLGGVGSPSTSLLATNKIVSIPTRRQDLRKDIYHQSTPPSNNSSPYQSIVPGYDGLTSSQLEMYHQQLLQNESQINNQNNNINHNGNNGSNGVYDEAWIALMRSKRSRQFSVGSAGSW